MRPRYFLICLLLISLSSSIHAIQLGKAAPRPVIYRPCETQVIIYDARPELGIGMHDMNARSRTMVQDLGIRLVRHTLYWNKMETTEKPGLYDSAYLSQWDKLVDDCRREGISLVVAVHGDPPGVSYQKRKAGYERYARFVSDMAARYPSVIYWELFNEMDSGFTCLFGANDNIPMRERGRNYAEMLKIAYPAIKVANPSAQVLCGGMSDVDEFPRGIYEAGGRAYFDIMNIHTYGVPVATAFVERGKKIREIMTEFEDSDKPVWNTEFGLDAGNVVGAWGLPHTWDPPQDDAKAFDDKQLEDYQNCLEMNNQLGLYNKVLPYQFQAGNKHDDKGDISTQVKLPKGMSIDDFGFGIVRTDLNPRPTYLWLNEIQANATIWSKPSTTVNVFVPTKLPMAPVGYDYRTVDGGIEIQRVTVDSLVPTRINLIYLPEPRQTKPGDKASPEQPTKPKGTRPIPDPFDI